MMMMMGFWCDPFASRIRLHCRWRTSGRVVSKVKVCVTNFSSHPATTARDRGDARCYTTATVGRATGVVQCSSFVLKGAKRDCRTHNDGES